MASVQRDLSSFSQQSASISEEVQLGQNRIDSELLEANTNALDMSFNGVPPHPTPNRFAISLSDCPSANESHTSRAIGESCALTMSKSAAILMRLSSTGP